MQYWHIGEQIQTIHNGERQALKCVEKSFQNFFVVKCQLKWPSGIRLRWWCRAGPVRNAGSCVPAGSDHPFQLSIRHTTAAGKLTTGQSGQSIDNRLSTRGALLRNVGVRLTDLERFTRFGTRRRRCSLPWWTTCDSDASCSTRILIPQRERRSFTCGAVSLHSDIHSASFSLVRYFSSVYISHFAIEHVGSERQAHAHSQVTSSEMNAVAEYFWLVSEVTSQHVTLVKVVGEAFFQQVNNRQLLEHCFVAALRRICRYFPYNR